MNEQQKVLDFMRYFNAAQEAQLQVIFNEIIVSKNKEIDKLKNEINDLRKKLQEKEKIKDILKHEKTDNKLT